MPVSRKNKSLRKSSKSSKRSKNIRKTRKRIRKMRGGAYGIGEIFYSEPLYNSRTKKNVSNTYEITNIDETTGNYVLKSISSSTGLGRQVEEYILDGWRKNEATNKLKAIIN